MRLVGLAAGAVLMVAAQPRPSTMAFTVSMERAMIKDWLRN
jgi:hypothetical protein